MGEAGRSTTHRLTSRLGKGATLSLAQLCTFAASLLPIVTGHASEIILLIFASGVSTVTVYPATLAAAVTLPPIQQPYLARRAARTSAITLGSITLAILAAGCVVSLFTTAELAFATAMILAGQGMYMLTQAQATRRLSYGHIGRLRIIYGVTSLTLVALVVLVDGSPILYVTAAAISYALAAATSRTGLWRLIFGRNHEGPQPDYLQSFWSRLALGLSLGIGNIAKQAPSLALPLLGPLAATWAVAARFGTGFQTVGGSVIGPSVDVSVSAAVQGRSSNALANALRRGIRISLSLTVGAAVSIPLLTIAFGNHEHASTEPYLLIAATVLWSCEAFFTPIGKILALLPGRNNYRFAFDVIQTALALIGLTLLRDLGLAIWLAGTSALSLTSYLLITRLKARAYARHLTRGS